jgi:hypothetical protein
MKRVLRLITILAMICALGSIILLLNFTAPNPTGRRYSSEMPLTTRQGDAQAIGLSAELILSKDLKLPRNEDASERQCICGNATLSLDANQCNACFAYSSTIDTYRRPDFVSRDFIAESKNRRNLLYTHTDQIEQIGDYASAARELGIPLILYIRVNTQLDPEFVQMVESTGGAVIPYFTVPGYIDPVDYAAQVVLLVSLAVLVVVVLVGRVARPSKITRVVVLSPKPPRPFRQPNDPINRALHKTKTAEDFVRRRKEKERQKIEIEDSRDDL